MIAGANTKPGRGIWEMPLLGCKLPSRSSRESAGPGKASLQHSSAFVWARPSKANPQNMHWYIGRMNTRVWVVHGWVKVQYLAVRAEGMDGP